MSEWPEIHDRRFWRYKTKSFFEAKKRQVYSTFVLFSKKGDIDNFRIVVNCLSRVEKNTLPVNYLIEMAVLYKQKKMVLFLLEEIIVDTPGDIHFLYTMCCKTFFEKNNEMYDIFFKKYLEFQKSD
jgi:hypothetical protein